MLTFSLNFKPGLFNPKYCFSDTGGRHTPLYKLTVLWIKSLFYNAHATEVMVILLF